MLVSSAACGADLIALDLARGLGIRRSIVLPFAAERFRETSVVDRPGEWGPVFDRVLKESEVLILSGDSDDHSAYARANTAILGEAQRLGRESGEPIHAAVVWDGQAHGEQDLTAEFLDEARRRGFMIAEIPTHRDWM